MSNIKHNKNYWSADTSIFSKDLNKKKNLFFLKTTFILSYFFACLFFILWITTIQYEDLIVSNSSNLSKFFYFLNPRLWQSFVFVGNHSVFFINATTNSRITFLILFYLSIITFVFLLFFSIALFSISTFNENHFYAYVSVFCMLPIIGVFLIKGYFLHLWIIYLNEKIKRDMSIKNVGEFKVWLYGFSSIYKKIWNFNANEKSILDIDEVEVKKPFLIKLKDFFDKQDDDF